MPASLKRSQVVLWSKVCPLTLIVQRKVDKKSFIAGHAVHSAQHGGGDGRYGALSATVPSERPSWVRRLQGGVLRNATLGGRRLIIAHAAPFLGKELHVTSFVSKEVYTTFSKVKFRGPQILYAPLLLH